MGKKSSARAPAATADASGDDSLHCSNIGKMSAILKAITFILALTFGVLHWHHTDTLFENDRHFSHLSNLEREMTFRTEMGLYYSYFKTVIEAPTFSGGLRQLYANNLTEFPNTINTLKRFNLYPEVAIGGLFRGLSAMNLLHKKCYTINRGEGLSPVLSCVGLGDPANFYINAVWVSAGATTLGLFLLATELGDSVWGGIVACLMFFFNHGECTRVQWTPPLRESFSYPISLYQMLAVIWVLRGGGKTKLKVFCLATSTCSFIITWQFAQFVLLTQLCSLYALRVVGVVSAMVLNLCLKGLLAGLFCAVVLMFGNEMLFTSMFFSAALCCLLVSQLPDKATSFLPRIVDMLIRGLLLPVGALGIKAATSRLLDVKDDAHIFEILRAKFSDFKSFHTLLYTCSKEFDFLGTEMPYKTTVTLLLPAAAITSLLIAWQLLKHIANELGLAAPAADDTDGRKGKREPHSTPRPSADPCLSYLLLQSACFAVLALCVMRLKLFWTPQLCVLSGLWASRRLMAPLTADRRTQLALVAALLAAAAVSGAANVRDQRNIVGEYSNPDLEELIEWVNANVHKDDAIAGPMSLMANLLLSTRRPVVNHPHYEHESIRNVTKKVYSIYSRRSVKEVHDILSDLGAKYVCLSSNWCLSGHAGGCGMADLWDVEEPDRASSGVAGVCPTLWNSPNPKPFTRKFANREYVLLKL